MKYTWTLIFSINALILSVMVIFIAGAGHGNIGPALIFFPLGFINIFSHNHFSQPEFLFLLNIFEYPVLGFLIDRTIYVKRLNGILIGLVIVHILMVFLIFTFKSSN